LQKENAAGEICVFIPHRPTRGETALFPRKKCIPVTVGYLKHILYFRMKPNNRGIVMPQLKRRTP